MSTIRPPTLPLPAVPLVSSSGVTGRTQPPHPKPISHPPSLHPADQAGFGGGGTQTVGKVAKACSDRWTAALRNGWKELRRGIVPNAVVTGILVAGSAVASTLPVLASAVVPVLLAPGFFLVCCVSDALRGLAFGAFPKADPGYWLKQLGQRLFKRQG